jgi:uncharacterized membrane-anchored protein
MKRLVCAILVLIPALSFAAKEEFLLQDSTEVQGDTLISEFTYQTGKIDINNGLATLDVPPGYKYLDAKQSQYVLHKVWNNPPDSSSLGMLFPEDATPYSENVYAIDITYIEDGHIKDDDAKDFDYEELLKQMQEDVKSENPERVKQGYQAIELAGWASTPFYDAENHKIHWAKDFIFEGDSVHTLNYNILALGRKGYLKLNVIGDMTVLPQVKKDVNKIISSVSYTAGNTYADFDPELDKVAAYGLTALVAGKVLAKAGFFAILLKFGKFIVIGLIAAFAAFRKKLFGKKEAEPQPQQEPVVTEVPGNGEQQQ